MKKKIAIAVAILLTLGIATSYAQGKYWIKVMDNTANFGLSKWCDNHNLVYLYTDGQGVSIAVVPQRC